MLKSSVFGPFWVSKIQMLDWTILYLKCLFFLQYKQSRLVQISNFGSLVFGQSGLSTLQCSKSELVRISNIQCMSQSLLSYFLSGWGMEGKKEFLYLQFCAQLNCIPSFSLVQVRFKTKFQSSTFDRYCCLIANGIFQLIV